jgi:hypothetical protein
MRKLLYISALCVYLSILLYACPIRPDSYQPKAFHKVEAVNVEVDTTQSIEFFTPGDSLFIWQPEKVNDTTYQYQLSKVHTVYLNIEGESVLSVTGARIP